MKDLLSSIKNVRSNTFTSAFRVTPDRVDQNGTLKIWDLLQEIEKSTEAPFQALINVAPEYSKQRKQVQLHKFGDARLNDELEFMSRFYPHKKRQVILKVFVRVLRNSKRARRIARVEYLFEAVHVQELSKTA